MDPREILRQAGFDRVTVLDGAECGIDEPTLLIAFCTYEAETEPRNTEAWIHPYYFVSQQAYQAAVRLPQLCPGLKLRDEIRVKPIFARLPFLTQGRNTLSCLPDAGSRFHVQIFTWCEQLPPDVRLLPEPKPLHCGDCRRCMAACPTGAIDEDGFHREKCLRNWQLGGRPVPDELRARMGNRLIGCDECQRCCPRQPAPSGEQGKPVLIMEALTAPKDAAQGLKELIGANLAMPNRVLAQVCLIAGNSGSRVYLPALEKLERHPSPLVAEQAHWAVQKLLSPDQESGSLTGGSGLRSK